MKLLYITFLMMMFMLSLKSYAQELKEFQQVIFCTPTKSELVNSLMITRVQELADEYPYVAERIKFKLVFSDYVEVKATNQADDQIRIRTQNTATIMEVTTSYFPIKFYAPNSIWRGNEHFFNFQGILDQGRYDQGKRPIELNCQSRLSPVQ